MNFNFSNLNKKQKEAVTFGKGPLLMVAGAGTGKTTTLVYRIAYLIKGGIVKPEEILALTFTNKAAKEMEERVNKMLPESYSDLWVSTFHVFCENVLRKNGLDIGLPTDFKLLNDTSSWLFVKRNFNKFHLDYYKPLSNPNQFIRALVNHFNNCKTQNIYPKDYFRYSQKVKGEDSKRVKEIAEAYKVYQGLLLENNLLNFGDLINYSLRIFQKRPLILKKYREKFKYLLIDEFQDINWSQYELIKILSQSRNNVMISTDDDQSIYQFRGASFNNIFRFKKDFPKVKQIVLNKNYRSTQNILDLSHKFIQLNNPDRLEAGQGISKKLLSVKKEKGIIDFLHFQTAEQEIRGVIGKINELLKKDKEAKFSDFAILVRKNDSARIFSRALERANFPYRFVALKGLYSKPVIVDIISYFELLDNYHEDLAVHRVLTFPFFNISLEDISKINFYSKRKTQSIYQSLKDIHLIKGLSKNTIEKVSFLMGLLKKHSLLAIKRNVSEVFVSFLQDSGYMKYLAREKVIEKFNYIDQFYNKLKSFEESNLDPRLKGFIEEINLELESGETGDLEFDPNQGLNTIKIMTVHTAKGLEFKYVFLVNLVARNFPSDNRKNPIQIPKELRKDVFSEEKSHLEEERRLFYVGMTRAEKGLFFTFAKDYGGLREKKPSSFLVDIGYKKDKIQKLKKENFSSKKIKKQRKINIQTPSHFSFSQIKAFSVCPLQYEFAHILKIPSSGKTVFSYGKTIHNTLYQFIKKFTKGKTKLKDLLKIYKEQWVDDWYYDKEQKEKYFQEGKKSLKLFYNDFIKAEPSILLIDNELALEKDFNLKIGNYDLKGKIDRIDQLEDGVEIIDYKTGKSKDKLKSEDKQQLLIYQMAAQEVFNLKVQKLTFYYIDDNKKLSFLGSEQEIEGQKKEIISQIKKIEKKKFNPTPGWNCKYCDFKKICNYAKK